MKRAMNERERAIFWAAFLKHNSGLCTFEEATKKALRTVKNVGDVKEPEMEVLEVQEETPIPVMPVTTQQTMLTRVDKLIGWIESGELDSAKLILSELKSIAAQAHQQPERSVPAPPQTEEDIREAQRLVDLKGQPRGFVEEMTPQELRLWEAEFFRSRPLNSWVTVEDAARCADKLVSGLRDLRGKYPYAGIGVLR